MVRAFLTRARDSCGRRAFAPWSRGLSIFTALALIWAPIAPAFAAEVRAERARAESFERAAAALGLPRAAFERPEAFRAEQDAARRKNRAAAVAALRERTRPDPEKQKAHQRRVARARERASELSAVRDFADAAARLAEAARAVGDARSAASRASRLESVRALANGFRAAHEEALARLDSEAKAGSGAAAQLAAKLRAGAAELQSALALSCEGERCARPLARLARLDAPPESRPQVAPQWVPGRVRQAAPQTAPAPPDFEQRHGALVPETLPPLRLATAGSLAGLLGAVAPPPAIGAPAPADLASTDEAPAADPAVAALATSLGQDTGRLFKHVYESVETAIYYGAKKGARGALAEGVANDVDQAALLVALLRASGVPARFVTGTAVLNEAEARDFTGTGSAQAAADFLLSQGFPVKLLGTPQGLLVEVELTWVRAHAPFTHYRGLALSQSQPQWVELAPALKRYRGLAPAANLRGKATFDFSAYVGGPQSKTPIESFEAALRQYVKTSGLVCPTLEASAERRVIEPLPTALLPAAPPVYVKSRLQDSARVSAALRHAVHFELSAGADTLLSADVSLPAAYGKALTLEYAGATPTDAQAIAAKPSLLQVAPYSVQVVAVLKVGGVEHARGAVPTSLGRQATLSVRYPIPGVGTEGWSHQLPTGAAAGYHLDSGAMPASRASTALALAAQLKASSAPADAADLARFEAVGALFFSEQDRAVASLLGHQRHRPLSDLSAGLARRQAKVKTVYGQVVAIDPGGWVIDVPRLANQGFPIDGDTRDIAFLARLAGYEGSLREATVFGRLFNAPGASAVRTLQAAGAASLSTFDSSTAAGVLPTLSVSASLKASMQGWLGQGATVTAHRAPTAYDGLGAQEGFIAVLPSGVGGYILGGLSGGLSLEYGPAGLGSCGGPLGGGAVGISGLPLLGGSSGSKGPSWGYGGPATQGPPGPAGTCKLGGAWVLDWLLVERLSLDVDVFDPAGNMFGFTPKDAVDYTNKPGTPWDWKLKRLAAGGWELRIGQVEKVIFDSRGRPVEVTGLFIESRRWVWAADPNDCCPLRTETLAGRLLFSFTCAAGEISKLTDVASRETQLLWDGRNLTRITDPDGKAWSFTYDPAGNLVTQRDRAGGLWSFDYGADRRAVRAGYPDGTFESFAWDTRQGLVTVALRDGTSEVVRYGPGGNILERVDAAGGTRTVSADPNGNPTGISAQGSPDLQIIRDPATGQATGIQSAGGRADVVRDSNGNVTSFTGPGGATTFEYSPSSGNISRVLRPNGAENASFTYDASGRLQTMTSGGVTQTFTYDASGELTGLALSGGRSISVGYTNGQPTTLSDGTTSRTLTYDGQGRLTGLATGGPSPKSAAITYDGEGRVLRQAALDGTVWQYTRDALGRPTTITNPAGLSTKVQYDAMGRPVEYVDPAGVRSTVEYDVLGRPAKITDRQGRDTDLGYCGSQGPVTCSSCGGGAPAAAPCDLVDAFGRRSSKTLDATGLLTRYSGPGGDATFTWNAQRRLESVTYPSGRVSRFSYTARGQQQTVTEEIPGRTPAVTTYTWQSDGNLESATDANGGKTTFTWVSGRLGAETVDVPTSVDPSGKVTTTYGYDALGRVSQVVHPSGRLECFTRDAYGQTTEAVSTSAPGATCTNAAAQPGARRFTWTYDEMGNLLTESGPAFERSYVQDSAGRLLRLEERVPGQPTPTVAAFEYTPAGRLSRLTASRGATAWAFSYAYDAAGRVAAITLPDGKAVRASYDAMGLLARVDYPSGQSLERLYDASGRVLSTFMRSPAGLIERGVAYRYDALGMVIERSELGGAKETYVRDALGRVTQSTRAGVATSYTYDAVGNLLSRGAESFTYDIAQRLSSAGTTAYTHDKDGLLVRTAPAIGPATDFTWTDDLKLAGIAQPGQSALGFDGDFLGRRVREQRGAVDRRLLSVAAVPLVITEGGALSEVHLAIPTLPTELGTWKASGFHPLFSDALGSGLAAYDPGGALTGASDYDPLGEPRGQSGAALPIGFAGSLPSGAGLTQMLTRQFDGHGARFTQPDGFSRASELAGLRTPGQALRLNGSGLSALQTQPLRFARYAHPPGLGQVTDPSGEAVGCSSVPDVLSGMASDLLDRLGISTAINNLKQRASDYLDDKLNISDLFNPGRYNKCMCMLDVIAAVDPRTYALIADTYLNGYYRGMDLAMSFAADALGSAGEALKSYTYDVAMGKLKEALGIPEQVQEVFNYIYDDVQSCPLSSMTNPGTGLPYVDLPGSVMESAHSFVADFLKSKIQELTGLSIPLFNTFLNTLSLSVALKLTWVMWFKTCQMAHAFQAGIPGGYGGCYPAGSGSGCAPQPQPSDIFPPEWQ